MKREFAEIVFPLPIDHAFTYRIPETLKPSVEIGCRVLAPFGKRRLTGYVVGIKDTTTLTDLKEIEDVLDAEPVFSPQMLTLAHWIADYYLSPLGEVLKVMLPAGIKMESQRIARCQESVEPGMVETLEKDSPRQAAILKLLLQERELSFNQIRQKVGTSSLHSSLNRLAQKGYIEISEILSLPKVKPKYETFVRLNKTREITAEFLEQLERTTPKRARCIRLLQQINSEISQAELLRQARVGSSVIKALVEKGLIETFKKEVERSYYNSKDLEAAIPLTLNQEQQTAIEKIKEALSQERFEAFLLHGVTGSGKTQVYIEAIRQVLQKGKGAIVLVPEIALTPQTVRRFQSNFPDQVAVLHSRMSLGERYDSWRKIKQGRYPIVIGARSAVFAPIDHLGLIVVDEEQEASYKQFDTNPLYHARDVAVMRAKLQGAVAILGSATPSAESFFNALTGKYQLLSLNHRIDDVPLPEVTIVDMIRERKKYGHQESSIFSKILREKIQEKLERKEQIILLQNRRGYSTFIKCHDCGHLELCVNCNITLTYHLKGYQLRCHYCGFTKKAPEVCPNCGGTEILFKGIGTQKVEAEVKKLFPQARLVRMDLDTTSRKWAHDRIINSFARGDYDILLGTQMVAKGLDFHRVTLVGVISADTGLLLPDFRAAERTFQLLTQVAGRAGRKELKGEVVIQTYSPGNYCLLCAREHDFLRFYKKEAHDRSELKYPPYGKLIHVLFKGENEPAVIAVAQKMASLLESSNTSYQLLGPTPAPLSKIQNNYRWQLILKADKRQDPTGKHIREKVRNALKLCQKKSKETHVRVIVDVDPVSVF